MSLKHVFIIHRQMGCNDEASTDEEQAEKILFFYPYDMSTYGQLTKINMLEGLIEFSNKFSSDPLDVVVMDKHTWGFFECEKDIWIIAAVDNNEISCEPAPASNMNTHRPNAFGLQLSIKKLYSMYYSFYGTFASSLSGENESGWKSVQAIQLIRKQIRKLNIRLRQQTQDLDTMNELLHPEVLAVDNPERMSETRSSEVDRKPRTRTISDINSLNIRSSEVSEHMGIQSHMTTVEQLNDEIAATKGEIAEKQSKLDVLYFDDSYYIARSVRDSLSRFMKLYLSSSGTGLSTSVGGASACSSFDILKGISLLSFGSTPNCNSSLMRLRQSLEYSTKQYCKGSVMLYDGQMIWSDLDNHTSHILTEFIHQQDVSALRTRASNLLELCLGDKARNNGNKFQVTDSEIESFIGSKLNEVVDGQKGFVCYGWESLDLNEDVTINNLMLWGTNSSDSSATVENENKLKPLSDKDVVADFCVGPLRVFSPRIYSQGVCIGRIMIYRHYRFVMVLLVPDWGADGQSFNFEESACRSFLGSSQQPNSSTALDKKNFVKVSQLIRHLTINADNASGSVLSNRHISPEALESASILAFCATVQQSVSTEVTKLDKAIKTANLKESKNINLANGSRNVNSLNKGMALNSSASAGARVFIPTTVNNSTSTNSAENSGTSSPLPPHMFSSGVTGSAAAAKDIRVIYYNSMSHSVKINNVYDGTISPIGSLSNETRDMTANQLRSKDAYARKVVYAVSDKLAYEIDSRFPHSSDLLSSCMEPAVMRALNDIWVEITAKELSGHHPHHAVVEACLRVSTAQRGGIWVTGRKMGDARYLFLVIDKCATLNEMNEIFEDICEGLQSRSLVL